MLTGKTFYCLSMGKTKKIPAVKIGRIWPFKKEVIDSFLEKKPEKNKK